MRTRISQAGRDPVSAASHPVSQPDTGDHPAPHDTACLRRVSLASHLGGPAQASSDGLPAPVQPLQASELHLPAASRLEAIDALAFTALRDQLTLTEGRRLGLVCRGLLRRTREAELHHPALARLAQSTAERRRLLTAEGTGLVPSPAALLLADTEHAKALAGVARAQARALAIREIKAAAVAEAASLQAAFASDPRKHVLEAADLLVCLGRPAEALRVLAWARAVKDCGHAALAKAAARAALHLGDGHAATLECEALLRQSGDDDDLRDHLHSVLGTIRLLLCDDAAGAREALAAMQVKDAGLDCLVKDALHLDAAATAALGAFLLGNPPHLAIAELCACLARTCTRAIDKAFYVDRALGIVERLIDGQADWRRVLDAARSPQFSFLHDQPRWKQSMGKFSKEWLAGVGFSIVLPDVSGSGTADCPAPPMA